MTDGADEAAAEDDEPESPAVADGTPTDPDAAPPTEDPDPATDDRSGEATRDDDIGDGDLGDDDIGDDDPGEESESPTRVVTEVDPASDPDREAGPDASGHSDTDTTDADAAGADAPDADEAGSDAPDVDADGADAADSLPEDDSADRTAPRPDVPEDVRTYDRFTKIDGATYERTNEFLRDRTYITAREWAIARLCADFRTETGVEMTKIGEHLPELVPFMTDTYSPQAVNQARHAFEEKVRKSGATFLYGSMSDFFTAEELDDVMYEATEVAKFLLEVEGVDLSVEAELEAEDEISDVMREVREHSAALRHDEVTCPDCGTEFGIDADVAED